MAATDGGLTLRVNRVLHPVTVLGPGRRLGVWVQGCTLGCSGCASSDTWDPAGGQQHTVVDLAAKFADQIRRDQLDGLSLTGGEPLQQASACTSLLDELATQLGTEPDVVLFTGYPLVTARRRAAALLDRCSVIVTGRYAAANPGTDPLVATANQQLTFRNEADRESYQAWADGRPRRLQVAVDDRDVFLVGIPRPRDLDDFAARLAERGVTFEALTWRS